MRFAILFLLGSIGLVATADAQQKSEILDYKTAYRLSQSGDKPMLVLVTATWCAPCQQMKASTLPQLLAKESFSQFHFAMIDLDAEPEIAQALIGNRGVPQLVLFRKVEGQWSRNYIAGMQTVEGVEAFIAKSSQIQIASAESGQVAGKSTVDKK